MRDTGLRWLGTVAVGVATIGFTGLAAPAQAMVVAGDQTCVGVDAHGHNDAARGGYGPDTRAVSSAEQRAIAQRTQRLLRAQPEKQAAAAEVTVPVAYHRHMSASGSINSWISAGRRPLVPSTAYTDELAARSPGVLTMHADNDAALRTALESAFADPASTWIDPAVTPSPTAADVGRAHERLFRRWSA